MQYEKWVDFDMYGGGNAHGQFDVMLPVHLLRHLFRKAAFNHSNDFFFPWTVNK